MSGIPLVHALHRRSALVDGELGAFAQNIEGRICHDGSDLDNMVVIRIEPRHLEVDPYQIARILRHRMGSSYQIAANSSRSSFPGSVPRHAGRSTRVAPGRR